MEKKRKTKKMKRWKKTAAMGAAQHRGGCVERYTEIGNRAMK
jgi:hypothetical protein